MLGSLRRRGAYAVVGGCLLALLGCAGGASRPVSDERPPILLITVDGLVASDLAPFGGAQPMPQLQRLIDQGRAWPRALSAVPMTRPAVATYLTGVAPDRHGVRDDLFATLPADIPTLAERLTAVGYRSAGFPDSSFLPERSGLWRGFELVDRPPPVAISASRWLPRVRPVNRTLEAFAAWIDNLEQDADWFGWVHLSYPLVGQIGQQYGTNAREESAADGASGDEVEERKEVLPTDDVGFYEEALVNFDETLGRILDRVDARPDGSQTWILLGGTLGDQRGDESPLLPGPGYSLAARMVEVPVIARFAGGVESRAAGEDVWAPDLAATIAAAAGVELSAQAEGASLTAPAPERTVFSWSWALLDQMGWRALALARNGEREMLVGTAAVDPEPADPALDDLRRALEGRANPPRAGLPDDDVAALLARFEIEVDPIPGDGRDFPDLEQRKTIADRIWKARFFYQSNRLSPAGRLLGPAKRMDRKNYAAHLDLGQMRSLMGLNGHEESTRETVRLRPDDPEAWHWYAHSLWPESWENAEAIISAVQPYLANQADALYDLACTRSMAGDLEVSADYLERAYLAGFRDRAHIAADVDLRNLRESEYYSKVMQRLY